MGKPENSWRIGCYKYLSPAVYHEKMHNPYRGGTPDDWFSGDARDLWAEVKFIVVPARDTTVITPNLSPLQLKWLTERHAQGRNCWVIVGCKEGGTILRNPRDWTGITTREFRQLLMSRKEVAQTIEGFVQHKNSPAVEPNGQGILNAHQRKRTLPRTGSRAQSIG